MRIHLTVVVLLAALLTGCAGKMDAKRGLSEEWRLRSLEENFLNFKESQRDQEERGKDQQRKLNERMQALEDSVQRLNDRVSGASPAQPLASAPAPKAQTPRIMPSQADDVPVAKTQESPAEQPAAEAAPAVSGTASQSLYTQGMTLVREEKSQEGRAKLEEFLKVDPGSPLVPNAIYWIGESRFQEKDYAQAILTFKDVTRRFPKHHKAAAALLKIGMTYLAMGEPDNASLYLRALLRDHPKSEPAPIARKKLAELGR